MDVQARLSGVCKLFAKAIKQIEKDIRDKERRVRALGDESGICSANRSRTKPRSRSSRKGGRSWRASSKRTGANSARSRRSSRHPAAD